MIHITLWQNEKEEIIAFEVDGHAGYGEEGWDIVCSAVSALTIAALNGLTEYVLLSAKIELRDGYVHCSLPKRMDEVQSVQAQAILRTLDLAFESIEDQYGRYVKLNRKNL